MARAGKLAFALALLSSLPGLPARADEPPPEKSELDLFALDSQLEQQVVSSTKTEQRTAQAPATITVIGAEEIQQRGYTSLADILRAVPGFYDVYDLVTHNIGVRGINGGARASGSVIKVMIDGHPVDYRPTTGNFFGEELIPLQVVERVEIIRGPASALYGANAFLGVVNVITKSGESINGARLVGQGAVVRNQPGGGGGIVVGGASGPVDVIAGVNYLYLDRSGLGLPASSPVSGSDRAAISAQGASQSDYARPLTAFAKLTLSNVLYGRLTAMASIQNLDAHGEFQDYGPLTHGTRITALNQNYRLSYEVTPQERFALTISGHYFNGAPTAKERLDIGRDDYLMLRSVAAQGFGFAAEGRIKAHRTFTLTVGADFVQEDHTLQTFDQKLTQDVLNPDGSVLRKSGTIIPGEQHGATSIFRNVGLFVQGVLTIKTDWSALVGARLDYQNIYGANVSPRAGIVYAPIARPLSVKLLYGSSFKAPSAEQLYTQQIKSGDIRGNASLQAQTAHTLELSGGYRLPKERGEIALNVFATDVIGRVEFIKTGLGGELDSRFMLFRPLHLRFLASVARTAVKSGGTPPGTPEVTNPLFPAYQFHVIADYLLPWWGLRLSGEVSYIGPRTASQSNAVVHDASYELPAYFYTAAVLSTAGRRIIPGRDTSFALRVSNVINQIWTEPGFGGIDVPAQGVTAFLTVIQSL